MRIVLARTERHYIICSLERAPRSQALLAGVRRRPSKHLPSLADC